MSKPRPTYTEEFRRDAVELLKTSGKPAAQVARELGVSAGALRSWREAILAGKCGWNELFEQVAVAWHAESPEACQRWLQGFPPEAQTAARSRIERSSAQAR